ncbi:SusD family protein [Sphingobacterium nematocida]|uniref:SusD family protein n=1 Tax=Sphingobacterium nematocida TaxID=1513896 RepID=A0A1T5AV57_9SPHI|nr:RagB/SusD family nutrient uptake outer membrane protein [Sphingobacterium nematocida]SKB38689.1 SusD family protein [Sphingobacterium nematocida]
MFVVRFFTSCNSWLDVKPEDKTLEEDIFRNEAGINNALNGVYHKLASNDLYGQNMTKSTLDILAQYYNSAAKTQSGINRFAEVANFNYKSKENQAYFEAIWTSSYAAILSINNLLEGLDKYETPLSTDKQSIIQGELYALRAFLHFDMLRLFGPVYALNPEAAAIPYVTTTEVKLNDLIPASKVINMVLIDLMEAERLLQKDPIVQTGIDINQFSNAGFYKNRNRRFNYYAAVALRARVHLYAGNQSSASEAAAKVIEEGSKWFPWQSEQEHLGIDANRIFSKEVLFGLDDNSLYTSYNDLFHSSRNDDNLLAPNKSPNVALDIYENNAQDFRYIAYWEDLSASQSATRPFAKLFIKYKDVDSRDKNWRNFQPLIRLSEMYYILTECSKNIAHLNMVRSHRGLEPLAANVAIDMELLKEYRKEFIGEGQLFYYYKRTNQNRIKGFQLNNITMSEAQYVIPLPLSESNQR